MGPLHYYRLCYLRVNPKTFSYTSYVLIFSHPSHDYSPVFHELSFSILTDKRVYNNIEFVQAIINGFADAPSLFFPINFPVPTRSTISIGYF